MQIKNHKLVGAAFAAARWTGGVITPEIVILHDTASRLEPGNAAGWLRDNPAKVSVHFVVERDGTVTQQVPTNRQANHAGQSSWQGRSGCNGFSIGIEIVNPGKLTYTNGGSALSWFGQEFGFGAAKLAEMSTPEHGKGVWMPYPAEQIDAVLALLEALFAGIKTLRDITTHWYVSPGRKVDTNPLFPLASVRARILGRDDPALIAAEAGSVPAEPGEYLRVVVPGSTLNVRAWPSFNPNVFAAAPHGAVLPVLRRRVVAGDAWACVRFDGREGWIVARHTEPLEKV